MPDYAHDVSFLPLPVDGVAHRLAINCKTLIFLTEGHIPLLQSKIELDRINPDQHIPNDGFTGNDVTFFYAAATKAFACLGAKVFCPFGNRFVTTHTAQGRTSGDTEHNAEPMSSTFGTARIRDVIKKIG